MQDKKYYRKYYLQNRAKIIARTSAYQQAHKEERSEYKRNWHLKRSYGVDQAEWQKLYKKQKGLCAICKKSETKINNKTGLLQPLCVDHNHKTGKVRGLLCCGCNRSIGLLGDNLRHINKVVTYLRRSNV